MHNHTELTQAEPCTNSTSSIATHLNKTLKRQRAIHMDRYTHAQSHTCVNTALTQAGRGRELYTWTGTHMHNHTELTQAEPCTNSTSSIATHLNKTLKRQRAIHMDRYTHAQSHTRVNTKLTQAQSHAQIVQAQSHTHWNKTLKRQRGIHMDRYTHAQSHTRVNTELTQAESHAPILQAQSHTHLNKTL